MSNRDLLSTGHQMRQQFVETQNQRRIIPFGLLYLGKRQQVQPTLGYCNNQFVCLCVRQDSMGKTTRSCTYLLLGSWKTMTTTKCHRWRPRLHPPPNQGRCGLTECDCRLPKMPSDSLQLSPVTQASPWFQTVPLYCQWIRVACGFVHPEDA